MPSAEDMSADAARRIALNAQGVGTRPRHASKTHLRRAVARLHVIQVDPISAVIRTQYLPAFSRIGAYPMSGLDAMGGRNGELFEYMAHDASLVSRRLFPLLRWRMEAFARNPRWRGLPDDLSLRMLAEVRDRGPLTGSELSVGAPRPAGARAEMWTMTPGRAALRWLWVTGQLVVLGRRGIDQIYDLPERVMPEHTSGPALAPDDARRELLLIAASALGVGTARDLADYFRLGLGVAGASDRHAPATRPVPALLADLVDDGELVGRRVRGWRNPAFLHPGATDRRRSRASCLLSPFDSLIWERDRVARLFGFHFRTEIYVPPAKREFGYYVMPYLHRDRLAARVDLKADRTAGALLVHGAFAEGHADRIEVAHDLAAELRLMAGWLGLARVAVGRRGNLAAPLQAASRSMSAKLPE